MVGSRMEARAVRGHRAQSGSRGETPRELDVEFVKLTNHRCRTERIEMTERSAEEGGKADAEHGADITIAW